MALGKKIIDWNDQEITKGMSTSSESNDGGFSPSTDQINLINTPGVAYAPAQATDKSTNVAGEIIASSPDPALLGEHRVFVDDEGHFYKSNSAGDITLLRTDAVQTYAAGFTSMTPFDGSVFTTSKEKVCKWTIDSLFNASYASFTSTNVMHPSLTFENNIYYGDKNLLLRQTDASAAPATILTLSSDQNIVALGIDPGTGLMLISTTTQLNVSDTTPTINKVHYYDGFSNKTRKTNIVDDMITAFYPNGGDIYITYGTNLGYWNGSGIQFLRKLNIARTNDTLAYLQHITNIESTVYVIEGSQILAHGPVKQNGPKVFYYAFKNQPSGLATSLTHICNFGSNLLAMAYATDQFFTWSSISVASISPQSIISNDYQFPNPVWIRRVKIWYKTGVTVNVSPGSLTLYNGDQNVPLNFGSSGLVTLTNNSGATAYSKEIDNINSKVDSLLFRLNMDTAVVGVKRFVVYADPADIT